MNCLHCLQEYDATCDPYATGDIFYWLYEPTCSCDQDKPIQTDEDSENED